MFDSKKLRQTECRIEWVGSSPVVVVDDILDDPEYVRTVALGEVFQPVPAGTGYYPGYTAPVRPIISRQLEALWSELSSFLWTDVLHVDVARLGDCFAVKHARAAGRSPRFAVYAPRQDSRFVHIHTDSHSLFAVLLYLSKEMESVTGTAFWSNRRTESPCGWEPTNLRDLLAVEKVFGLRVVDGWREHYALTALAKLEKTIQVEERPLLTVGEINAGFECRLRVPFRFNRLVAYPTWLYHSVDFRGYKAPTSLEDARLTMNQFLSWPLEPKPSGLRGEIPLADLPALR